MSSSDEGLLGNLPRTRPGTRSEKRDEPLRAAPSEPHGESEPLDEAQSSDPMGDVLRAAGGAAQAGARIAQDLTRELLRRLPRP